MLVISHEIGLGLGLSGTTDSRKSKKRHDVLSERNAGVYICLTYLFPLIFRHYYHDFRFYCPGLNNL